MNEASQNNKITLISLGILVVLLLAVFVCWAATGPQALESVKEISVTIAHSDDFIRELEHISTPEEVAARDPFVMEFETTARTFPEAIAPYGLMEFLQQTNDVGEPSLILSAADGEYADQYRGYAWFCYYNSDLLEEPLDTLLLEDGDKFYFYTDSEY